MTGRRLLKTFSLIAITSLVAASLPSMTSIALAAGTTDTTGGTSHTGHNAAGSAAPATSPPVSSGTGSNQNQTIPPDMGSWLPLTPDTPADTTHPTNSQNTLPGSPVHGGSHQDTFTDIATHWAKSDIESLHQLGIINGDGSGRFDPERHITRAELIKMLVTVARVPAGGAGASMGTGVNLAGVDTKSWYYPYVMSAISAGIVRGTDGKFEPEGMTTRELFAAMTVRAAGKDPLVSAAANSAASYGDYGQISPWARGYVGMAKELGIMQGYGGMIVPQAHVTRAESVSMIARLMKLDQTPATVRLMGRGTTSVKLEFSEPVDPLSAESLPSYEVSGLQVKSAQLQIDGKTVVLTTGPQTSGQTYQLKVRNVRDKGWNVMVPVALSFTAAQGPVPSKAIYKDSRHVEIQFNKELFTKTTPTVNVVNRATGKAFGGPYKPGIKGSTLIVMLSADMTPGATYTISLSGFKDAAGIEMAPATLNFSVSQTLFPPTVTRVTVSGRNTFDVDFSKPLRDMGTYEADGFVSATPAFIGTSRTKVRVTVTTNEPDGGFGDRVAYAVSIRDVVDTDGKSMPAKTQQISYAREKVAPTITTVRAVSATAVEVVFSEPVQAWSAEDMSNYSLVRQNTAVIPTWSSTRYPLLSADGKTLRLYLEEGEELASGARYVLTASAVLDLAGNALATVNQTFTYSSGQTATASQVEVDRTLTRISGANSVQVVFTGPVDVASGTNKENYSLTSESDLSARLSIDSARVDANDRTTVTLVTGTITTDLRLTVRNVKSTVPTVVHLPRPFASAVTAVRTLNERVELTLSDPIGQAPDVRIYPTGLSESESITGVTLEENGSTVVVPYDWTGGFNRAYTLKVSGNGVAAFVRQVTPQQDTTAPTVTSVAALDRDKVAVTFSEDVTVLLDTVTIGTHQLIPTPSGPATTWIYTIPDVDNTTIAKDFFTNGSTQTLAIAADAVEDRNGLLLSSAVERTFRVAADTTRPSLASLAPVAVLNENTVRVTFSEAVVVEPDAFRVARAGAAIPIRVLSAIQTAPNEAKLTLDLAPSSTPVEYILTVGPLTDTAVAANRTESVSARFWSRNLAIPTPAVIYLSRDASNSQPDIIVTDNAAGQEDRIQGDAGSVEGGAWVMIYVDNSLEVVTRASSSGSFGPVPLGDYDSSREVRVVVVDLDGNTAETSAMIDFSR